jgi:ferredoxin-NADP reductase
MALGVVAPAWTRLTSFHSKRGFAMTDHVFKLKERFSPADNTIACRFDTTSAPDFDFQPGQTADFTLEDLTATDNKGNQRTFSLASSPHHKGSVMIATRLGSSAFKKALATRPLGTPVKVTGPMGSFTLHKNAKRPAILLAGGIGITPFHSIIEWAAHQKLPHQIRLFYANHAPKQAAFLADLERWQTENPNFKFIATVTVPEPGWKYETGRIDQGMLKRHLGGLEGAVYYIAGPPGLVTAMRQTLLDTGVSEDDLRTEEFSGYE